MRTIRALVIATVIAMLGLASLLTPQAHGSAASFISSLVPAAQETQRKTGIPASVTIGMAALETGWGRSGLSLAPKNSLFSIKCTATVSPYQNGCVEVASYEYDSSGRRYMKVSKFRSYATRGDSLKDFGRLLTNASRYAGAFRYKDNPDAFVREVHRAGYATDPRYTELVVGIMRRHNLYQYNVGGSTTPTPTPTPDPVKPSPTNPIGDTSKLPVTSASYKDLSYGSRGEGVKTLQRLLAIRMKRDRPSSGFYGWQTQDAVAHFQASVSFKEMSGDVDRATWEALVPTIRPGERGPLVTAMQEELRHAGYTMIEADGIFGAKTRAAVEDFQRRHSLPVTGTVAKMTWGRLLGN